MKKLLLILSSFLLTLTIYAQKDTTISIKIDSNVVTSGFKAGITSIEIGIENIQNQINAKLDEIDLWAEKIDNLGSDPDSDNDDKIDSLENLIDRNKEVIEKLDETIEDLEDAKEDLQENYEEVEDIDVEINLDDEFLDIDENFNGKKERKFRGHWFGVNLGVNTYLTPQYDLNLPADISYMSVDLARSREFSINIPQFNIPFFNRYVGAVTGIGFTFNNYELEENVLLDVNTEGELIHPQADIDYHKNRFKTGTFTVPLMIEFQIPVNEKDKRIFFAAGVIGNLNLHGKMKTVYFENNSKVKYKDKSSKWPLTKYSYQLTARLGYHQWYLYANYSMMPMFEENLGPQIHPVSAGIGLRF